jgi:predicted PhzF superfamily epimerase YddE/YHI9
MPPQANLFQVGTFASDPLRGNPAYVLTDVGGATERGLMAACAMLRTDIIAVVGDGTSEGTPLRFFTRNSPHPGAGHATLAAAHAVLRGGFGAGKEAPHAVIFRQANGESRAAHVESDRISIDFPVMPAVQLDCVADMEAALGAAPRETWVAPFGDVAIFNDPGVIAELQPDLARVSAFDRNAVIVTALGGTASDVVIRVFAPKVGLPEDPVCGTAHRIIVPYWAKRLGKAKIHSRQLSARGGDLWCEDKGEYVAIAGETCLIIEGTVRLPSG